MDYISNTIQKEYLILLCVRTKILFGDIMSNIYRVHKKGSLFYHNKDFYNQL